LAERLHENCLGCSDDPMAMPEVFGHGHHQRDADAAPALLAALTAERERVRELEAALTTTAATELWGKAPPKIEGGSPARQQWLADVMAAQMTAYTVGLMQAFVDAMNGEETP
jgi:hypothetical protein